MTRRVCIRIKFPHEDKKKLENTAGVNESVKFHMRDERALAHIVLVRRKEIAK